MQTNEVESKHKYESECAARAIQRINPMTILYESLVMPSLASPVEVVVKSKKRCQGVSIVGRP